ncbi:MAG: coiled-coil domain-containing protein, partial [Trebouxia sp. A1-2]
NRHFRLIWSCKAGKTHVLTPTPRFATAPRVQAWAERVAGHVEEVAIFRAGGLSASVRTIAHCGFTGTVAYSLIGPGSHYCEHIGRCHQSNRVFFVVNFLTGMLAQKCHDPDCSHFRSTWTPLPPHMLNPVR